MAFIDTFDFSKVGYTPDWSGLRDAVKNYYEGEAAAQQSQVRPDMLEAERSLKQTEAMFKPQSMQADIAYKLSQADKASMGGDLTGTAGNILKLDRMIQSGKIDPKTAEKVKRRLELERKREETLQKYQESLIGSMGKRYSTPQGKMLFELSDIQRGYQPGTADSDNPVKLTPEQQRQYKNQYDLKLLEMTSDPEVRSKIRYATNVDTTLGSINIDDMANYAGLAGQAAKKIEQGKTLTSSESEAYKRYQEGLTSMGLLVPQLRQFYGESVSDQTTKDLEFLVNPDNLLTSPEVYKRKFNRLVSLFDQESDNFRKSAVDSSFYGASTASFQGPGYNQPPQATPQDIQDAFAGQQGAQSQGPSEDIVVQLTELNKIPSLKDLKWDDVLLMQEKYKFKSPQDVIDALKKNAGK